MIHSPPGRPAPQETSGPRQWPRTGKVEVRLMNGGLAGFIGTALADWILTSEIGVVRNNRRKTYVQLNEGVTLYMPEYKMRDDLRGPRSHGGWHQQTKGSKNVGSAMVRSIQTKIESTTEKRERVEIVEHIKYGDLPFTANSL